ncbi:YciI family protein [Ruania alba]|uniref:Uncharacterized conserved protein n=1 Tax=Ruania alba TaxID=648782 RepID=A0A1H5L9D9_9MICO|nr:hypothetical protein [Ruania alba]SEE73702.1 Uncharacterized conserved protein [Ruania alba]
MTDTWVFLIREPDWDSDAFLPENLAGRDPFEISDDMAAQGKFEQVVKDLGAKVTGGQALQNASYGGWVKSGQNGAEPVYTDAPFTDSSEVITGFYTIECDEATARRLAGLLPSGNIVEWRKVHQFE